MRLSKKQIRQNKKLGLMGRTFRHVFGGYDVYGPTNRASLMIGRVAGIEGGIVPEGKVIPSQKIADTVAKMRIDQVGFSNASSTLTLTEGRYKGTKEPSVRLDIYFDGGDGTPAKFKRNIQALAENAAKVLGQREILIEWQDGGKKVTTATASPKGAPASTSPKFCDWIRKNSKSARTNPNDSCYRKKSPR
jgi:hypothetical protein